jgi:hypothetical protein
MESVWVWPKVIVLDGVYCFINQSLESICYCPKGIPFIGFHCTSQNTYNLYQKNPGLKASRLLFQNHFHKQLRLRHTVHSGRTHSHHCENNPQCFVHGPHTSGIRRKILLERGQNMSPRNSFWNKNNPIVDRSHQPIKTISFVNGMNLIYFQILFGFLLIISFHDFPTINMTCFPT